LASDELKKHDEEIRRFAVFHEIGHFWSVSVLGGETNTEDEEAFADAFATYFLSPSSLTGPWSAFLSTKCFEANDAERVETFAEEIIKNLEKAL
jgi:Zn-dependent peptidase ImmA (M78 family)